LDTGTTTVIGHMGCNEQWLCDITVVLMGVLLDHRGALKNSQYPGHYFVIISYNSGTQKYLIHDTENDNEYWVTQSEAFVNGLSTFGRSQYILT